MNTAPQGASVPLRPEDFLPPLDLWLKRVPLHGAKWPSIDSRDGKADPGITLTMSASTLSAICVMVADYALTRAPRYEKRSMKRDGYSLGAIEPVAARIEVRK